MHKCNRVLVILSLWCNPQSLSLDPLMAFAPSDLVTHTFFSCSMNVVTEFLP